MTLHNTTPETLNSELAALEDAPALLDLQRLCFQSESDLIGGRPIPPLTQTLEGMQKDLAAQVVLVIRQDGRLMGSVRAHQQGDTCHIGRLMVHPDLQGQGFGKRLMADIEGKFPGARRFELFTGKVSLRNIRLYEQLGYHVYAEREVAPGVILVDLEKIRHQI